MLLSLNTRLQEGLMLLKSFRPSQRNGFTGHPLGVSDVATVQDGCRGGGLADGARERRD